MNAFVTLCTDLAERGWSVCDDFLPAEAIAALRAEAGRLWQQRRFRPAGIGRGEVRAAIRSDCTLWLDEAAATPAQRAYRDAAEALRAVLNRELFLGLAELEAHYAVYPQGAFYRKHLDRFADADERSISLVLYLNADWHEADGGQLRLYTGAGALDVLPAGGRCVVFRSDALYHEVLPARRVRYSLAGWFRRRVLGRVA